MVLLLPLGAMFMRLGASVYLHGAWQLFALCAMLCGFGLGIKLAQMRSLVGSPSRFSFALEGLVEVVVFLSLLAASQVRLSSQPSSSYGPRLKAQASPPHTSLPHDPIASLKLNHLPNKHQTALQHNPHHLRHRNNRPLPPPAHLRPPAPPPIPQNLNPRPSQLSTYLVRSSTNGVRDRERRVGIVISEELS